MPFAARVPAPTVRPWTQFERALAHALVTFCWAIVLFMLLWFAQRQQGHEHPLYLYFTPVPTPTGVGAVVVPRP